MAASMTWQEAERSLEEAGFVQRLWQKDASLWSDDPQAQAGIGNSLGWLDVVPLMESRLEELEAFRREVRAAGLKRVVLLGMGGSSLAPLVFQRSCSQGAEGLSLTVLDTTDPATVLAAERGGALAETLFIVASKSGGTAEPAAFAEYFYARLQELGGGQAGDRFVAITDPGSPLAQLAAQRRFRRTFLNFQDIGGRYSALSYFGLVPAALMDIDLKGLLGRARQMAAACREEAEDNPGVSLGGALGAAARRGRDKVTLIVPPAIATFGMWLEQLLAESTGKNGVGLLPVAGEGLVAPERYGDDRIFVYISLENEANEVTDQAVAALQERGRQPVISIALKDQLDLGGEFFRWEVATATAGFILGINPFDQPNVQESKTITNRLLAKVAQQGQLPEPAPLVVDEPLTVYGAEPEGREASLAAVLKNLLVSAQQGNYLALLAFLTEEPAVDSALAELQALLRDRLGLATTSGYGPRYLHSTGQLHKGGPNTGLFLLLTAADSEDAAVPGSGYGFSTLKRAQALGDFEALGQHGRRVLRVDLGADAAMGLSRLKESLTLALNELGK